MRWTITGDLGEMLSSITDPRVSHPTQVEVLTNEAPFENLTIINQPLFANA